MSMYSKQSTLFKNYRIYNATIGDKLGLFSNKTFVMSQP